MTNHNKGSEQDQKRIKEHIRKILRKLKDKPKAPKANDNDKPKNSNP